MGVNVMSFRSLSLIALLVVSVTAKIQWTKQTPSANLPWYSLAYGGPPGEERFVAGALAPDQNAIMTSDDGSTWTNVTSPIVAKNNWLGIVFGGPPGGQRFVAVSNQGAYRVITSPTGLTWTNHTMPNDNYWGAIVWGGPLESQLFVAVAYGGISANRVATSIDGMSWVARPSSDDSISWGSIAWGGPSNAKVFVAVAYNGVSDMRAMSSPSGTAWSNRSSLLSTAMWRSVTWGGPLGSERFVAVASHQFSSSAIFVMTSPDGLMWTSTSSPSATWYSVTYATPSPSLVLFVAVALTGQVMVSADGLSWTQDTKLNGGTQWSLVTYGAGAVVAASSVLGVMKGYFDLPTQPPPPTTSSAPADVCQQFTDCLACAGASCVWCQSTGRPCAASSGAQNCSNPVAALGQCPSTPCEWIDAVLPFSNHTINSSCPSLLFRNVTAAGNMVINVSIPAIVAANPLASSISITFSKTRLEAGVSLLFEGFSSDGDPTSLPAVIVEILVTALSGIGGRMTFMGAFPGQTLIIVDSTVMEASDNIPPPDAAATTWLPLLLFSNLKLSGQSILDVYDSSFVVKERSNPRALPFGIGDGLTIRNDSFLHFTNCTFQSFVAARQLAFFGQALLAVNATIVIAKTSRWITESCHFYSLMAPAVELLNTSFACFHSCTWNFSGSSFTSQASDAMRIVESAISLERSQWNILGCRFQTNATGHQSFAWSVIRSSLSLLEQSEYTLCDSNFSSLGMGQAFLTSSSTCAFSGRSRWLILRCTMTAGMNALIASAEAAALILDSGSYLGLENGSTWMVANSTFESVALSAPVVAVEGATQISMASGIIVQQCRFIAGRGPASSGEIIRSQAAFVGPRSAFTILSNSYFLFIGNLLRSRASTTSGPVSAIVFPSESVVTQLSWILLASNTLVAEGSADSSCIEMNLFGSGALSLVDNNCTLSLGGGLFRDGTAFVDSSGSFHQKCNRVNGVLVQPGVRGMPLSAITAGVCGTCSPIAECYSPLVRKKIPCVTSFADAVSNSNNNSGDWEWINITTAVCTCRQGAVPGRCLPVTNDSFGAENASLTETASLTAQLSVHFSHSASESALTGSTSGTLTEPQSVTPFASLTKSISDSSSRPTRSTTDSQSCRADPGASENATLSLLPIGGGDSSIPGVFLGQDYFSGGLSSGPSTKGLAEYASSLSVSRLIYSTSMIIHLFPADGVQITAAGNVTCNFGSNINIKLLQFPENLSLQGGGTRSQGDSATCVRITLDITTVSSSSVSLSSAWALSFEIDAAASGRCLPPGYRARLKFRWDVLPQPPPTALRTAAVTLFHTSTVATSLVGNPIVALTLTSALSAQLLTSCEFTDVDPVDSALVPIPWAVGPELGAYYRGACLLVLMIYYGGLMAANAAAHVMSLERFRQAPPSAGLSGTSSAAPHELAAFAKLRFPSIGIVVVSLFGEGLASCGMALFRQFITGGSSAWGDLLLAVFSLMTCVAVATWAFYTTTGSRLQVITEDNPFPSALTSLPLILHRLAKLATWEQHYIDCSDELYKRRHLMLIDGLRVPWWTALEIASALFQGTTLGVRVNSLSICRTQQWIMTFQTAAIFCLAFYYHPFGAKMPNYFLVLSKFSAFVISLLGLLETLLFDDALSFASNIVATVAMAIGTFDVGFSVFLLVWAVVVPKITAIGRRKARQARNIETELISCVSPDPLRFSPPTDTVCVPPQTILGEAVPTPPLREKKQSAPLFHSKSLSSEACDEREAAQQRLLSQVLDRLTVAVDPTPAPELREARFRALVESICLHSQLIQSKKMTEQVLRGEQR